MMHFLWWEVLLILGAAIRLTRLIVDDTLTQPFRYWVEEKESDQHGYVNTISFTTLLGCSWCTGIWVAGLIVGLSAAWSGFFWLWGVLSVGYVVGLESVLREKLEVG